MNIEQTMLHSEAAAPTAKTALSECGELAEIIFSDAKLRSRNASLIAQGCAARAELGMPVTKEINALMLYLADIEMWLEERGDMLKYFFILASDSVAEPAVADSMCV